MPIAWEFRSTLLAVTETGLVPNREIQRAFLGEALSDARSGPGTRVLWDARESETPLSAEDVAWRTETLSSLAQRGVLSRFALILRADQRDSLALGRSQMPKAVHPLQFGVFTQESEALAWLRS